MSRNGTGQYSLPNTVNPVVTDTTITSTWANTTLDDIATELTNSLPRDGQAAPTANLPMGGYKLTGLAVGSASTDSVTYGQVFTSPAFTGTPTAPTAAAGTNTTQVATTAFVAGTAFSSALPAQTGNSGKSITTDGATASWGVSGVTGGGTGQSSYTIGDILYASGATTLSKLAAGTAGYALTSGGPGVAPSWAAAGIGAVTTTSGSANITLTASSNGYQDVTMTAMGKHVTLPDATTMTVGGPRFILKNSGGYPFGVRDSAGTLVGAVAAGGIAYVTLKDSGSAAGSWSVIGDNLEPGLITIDNTFSSTYASTVLKPFVALDDNKSIHFLALASGFAAVAVDKTTGAVGTPVTVSANASSVIRAAFKVSSTSAIVFFKDGALTQEAAVVVSLSGATTLSVGTSVSSGSSAAWSAEDFSGAPKIAQLTSTLYVASNTGGTYTQCRAVSVSGATVTIGSGADIITTNSVADSTTTYALTATTALVLYKSGAGAPYANNAVVVSVSGTTCTIGTPAALTNCASSVTGAPPSALVSATKCVVADDNNGTGAVAAAVTISGTTVTAGTAFTVEASAVWIGNGYTANSATRYTPHLWTLTTGATNTVGFWYVGSSISRAVVLSESGGTVTAGTKLYRSISTAAATAAGGGAILPQGTSEFLSVNLGNSIADGGSWRLTAHKISGTSVTAGNSVPLNDVPTNNAGQLYAARLSSGDYVSGFTVGDGCSDMKVFRNNGDCLNYRGFISCPNLGNAAYPIPTVSSNRIVVLGSAERGTTVSSSTTQLRLLSVEIAQ